MFGLGIVFTTISSCLNVIASVLKAVGKAIEAFCKELGLIDKDIEIEDLGDKTIQAEEAGITPEKYENFQDYIRSVEKFEVDPKKSAQISEEDKLKRGIDVAGYVLQEKYPQMPVTSLFELANTCPSLMNEAKFVELAKAVNNDATVVNNIVGYLNGTEKNDAKIGNAIGVLRSMEQVANPKLSDIEATKAVVQLHHK